MCHSLAVILITHADLATTQQDGIAANRSLLSRIHPLHHFLCPSNPRIPGPRRTARGTGKECRAESCHRCAHACTPAAESESADSLGRHKLVRCRVVDKKGAKQIAPTCSICALHVLEPSTLASFLFRWIDEAQMCLACLNEFDAEVGPCCCSCSSISSH